MLQIFIKNAIDFQSEAHRILCAYEESPSRVVILNKSYETLGKLSIKQDDLFRMALRCCEEELYRAAHVMAWAGFMDFLEEKLSSDGFKKVNEYYPNWKICSIEELREKVTEHQIIEAGNKIGLYGKNQKKALFGLLNKRNECAHPSSFYPGLNETLGYISEIFQRIKLLKEDEK
jgi:hypothetical protein